MGVPKFSRILHTFGQIARKIGPRWSPELSSGRVAIFFFGFCQFVNAEGPVRSVFPFQQSLLGGQFSLFIGAPSHLLTASKRALCGHICVFQGCLSRSSWRAPAPGLAVTLFTRLRTFVQVRSLRLMRGDFLGVLLTSRGSR